jgi:mannose-6-phosphate isomerase-like protein (cupin superfamily)
MLIKDIRSCDEIIAGDGSLLKELLNPIKEEIKTNYSLAHAVVKPGITTLSHKLKSTEVYYILQGEGEMFIDNESGYVYAGNIIYIPPNSVQRIRNISKIDLIFLCIVDPAWKKEDEEVIR